MNNQVCTPATSRRLREQGFPQPVPAPGQVWYTANGTPFVIIFVVVNSDFFFAAWPNDTGTTTTGKITSLPSCTYAPTAPDILRELGHGFYVCWHEYRYVCRQAFELLNGAFNLVAKGANDNPAEACAMAWEAKQKP